MVREDLSSTIHALFAQSPYELTGAEFVENIRRDRYVGYFKFAFVRNPWDRLVSCYLQKLAPGSRDNAISRRFARRAGDAGEDVTFTRFAEAVCEIPDDRANPHFRSQHVGLLNDDGELLPDFMGSFENLSKHFAHAAKKIGTPHLELPHLTPSLGHKGRSYRDFYDGELAQKVGERFRKDVELFGYDF